MEERQIGKRQIERQIDKNTDRQKERQIEKIQIERQIEIIYVNTLYFGGLNVIAYCL